MKTTSTLTNLFTLLILLFTSIAAATAQPRYVFSNSSRISGTARQVGAVYRFPNVRTGVDALVTITAITGGLTINTFDDNSSGFNEAFQPTITLPARSKGYAEFSIVFVTTGTSTPLTQSEIPVTPIDIDGQAGTVYEFDNIYRNSSSYVDYNSAGTEIKITYPAANMVEGLNVAGISYGGIDTTAKNVMFTVVNSNISTLVVRVGADNKSNSSQQRLRSLYFQRFRYPSSVLSVLTPATQPNNTPATAQKVKVYPTAFQNNITLQLSESKESKAIVRLIDYSGRILKEELVNTQKGNNNININHFNSIPSGNYIVTVSNDNVVTSQKVIKL